MKKDKICVNNFCDNFFNFALYLIILFFTELGHRLIFTFVCVRQIGDKRHTKKTNDAFVFHPDEVIKMLTHVI